MRVDRWLAVVDGLELWGTVRRQIICMVLFSVLVVGLGSSTGLACSSFAVYGDEVYYGSNFDFELGTEVRFTIQDVAGEQLFLSSFRQGTQWLDVVGYNTRGLFATLQMVSPRESVTDGQETMMVPQLMAVALYGAEDVSAMLEILGDARLVPVPGFYLHSLYADTSGHAVVVEAGENANFVETIMEDYLVMTNFYHQDLTHMPIEAIENGGADRYIKADAMIAERMAQGDGFGMADGLSVLEAIAQGPNTLFSLVVDPDNAIMYLALDANYARIWQVDVRAKTIRGWRGVNDSDVRDFPRRGMTAAELRDWE